MLIKKPVMLTEADVTDASIFHNRRNIIKAMLAIGAGYSLPGFANDRQPHVTMNCGGEGFCLDPAITPTLIDSVKNYTNYYEFAYNKTDSSHAAQLLPTRPWTVEISGEVEKPTIIDLDDLVKRHSLQQRIYRFRCVEGWAMVVPWSGFPLAELLQLVKPLSSAKFVKFTSLQRPDIMRQQQSNAILTWPYIEGLRIDEATHPLTLLAVGMYDETLPKQNGAPLRLVVPWKYGFKSIKAIVKIELLRRAPETSWHQAAPGEYGFYANVNPQVPHPRWSQNSERVLGSDWFTPRRKTELFNGYGEQVASLYADMDLRHFF
jgi:sulfoxide reductase catalytic subunit YedY